jgi:hypothetical protein
MIKKTMADSIIGDSEVEIGCGVRGAEVLRMMGGGIGFSSGRPQAKHVEKQCMNHGQLKL